MKLVKILAVSCAITIMSSFSAFASWEQVDGAWKYKDEVTEAYVTSQWIESATEKGLWYYLNEQGVMAVHTVIDNQYYVNERGEWRDTTGGSKDNSNMDSWLNEDGTVYLIPDDVEFDTTPGWGGKDVIVG